MKRRLFLFGAPALLAGCAARFGPPSVAPPGRVEALTRALIAMSPVVDPQEAASAAALAYSETHRLAIAYEIVDPPLLHNIKVNAGQKPRGLCWHWAEDMEARLNAEGYRTLALHRAIANADSDLLIDHSTAIIAPVGAAWDEGMVLDPWRYGGELFWARVREDTRYDWDEREAVMRRHGRIRYLRQGAT